MRIAASNSAISDTRRAEASRLDFRFGSNVAVKRLGERQGDFAKALIDPQRPVPPGLVGPDGRPSAKRFNVYRNNVVAGLTATLKDAFPAVARIVGEPFFTAMARIYVAGAPPTSPMMFDYGVGFPDFVGAFAPAQSLCYLRDIARVERAWVEAYHAAEAQPLDPLLLTHVGPDDLPNLRVSLHPSLRLVRSRFPALRIWQMNIKGGVPEGVDLNAGGDDILVVRPDAEVKLRVLPPGGAVFIQALVDNCTIVESMRAATIADRRFDLSANLSGLFDARGFVGFEIDSDPLPLNAASVA
jgi:Putative DNA-binding domain